jgi:hypothetical protein
VLFDARGERLRPEPLKVKEGRVESLAFGPGGVIAAGYIGSSGSGVVVFDARGERLRPEPLEVREGYVGSVAFGPEGQLAAGYYLEDRDGGVVLFDNRGVRLGPRPLEVKGGHVASVAFGPEGQLAAGYGLVHGDGGGVALFDTDPSSWVRKAGRVAGRNFLWREWMEYCPGTAYRRTLHSLPWPHDLPEPERKQAEAFEKEHPGGSEAP